MLAKFKIWSLLTGFLTDKVCSCLGCLIWNKYKNKSKGILARNADPVTLLLKFRKVERIYQVFGFIYLNQLNLKY